MLKINENYNNLQGSYLFSEIAKRVAAYSKENPNADIIKLGIGDVSLSLPQSSVDAMKKACDELSDIKTFKGYPPDRGYSFLIDKIIENDFKGLNISPDEVFVSDGAKSDTGNISDIFGADCKVAVCDPVYPVYVDSNVMAGRSGKVNSDGRYENLIYLPCVPENNFCPVPEKDFNADIIYLCYPNNPTGATITKDQLKLWVDYAINNKAIILYDAAYEAFIREGNVPHSIYEIEGAKKCAIEFRSFSKTAGFTGVRCAYAVVPKELVVDGVSLNFLWGRRQATKFNGVSYVTQRGAEALYTEQGKAEIKERIDYYLKNAATIYDGLKTAGLTVYGAKSSPYIWLKTPDGFTSWEYFDYLLKEKHIVGTPGVGFGMNGEGFLRLTAFNTYENTLRAIDRIIK